MAGASFDESIPFKGLRVAVMTVSDTRTEATDKSGAYLVESALEAGHQVMDKVIVPDDRKRIEVQLRRWVNEPNIEVVLATGGTGVTARDVTPEAFEAVWEKPIPGFGELFRMLSYEQIGTSTIQSRACAGVARGTYLFALPGSTGACRDAWTGILRYQLDIRYRPCNFAELIPRLQEGSAGTYRGAETPAPPPTNPQASTRGSASPKGEARREAPARQSEANAAPGRTTGGGGRAV